MRDGARNPLRKAGNYCHETGREKEDACKGENSKNVEMVRGENSPKALEYMGGVHNNSNLFFCRGRRRSPH